MSLCLSFVFFYYEHDNHPDLHSFPTRRSSDLSESQGARPDAGAEAEPRVSAGGGERETRQAAESRGQALKHCDARDRKSTRLNSSHTVISYAVFCLKKKKKKKINNKI